MPPELSSTQSGADVQDEGIFSKIPMWAWIAGGVIVLYVLYTKFASTSTSNPAVSTSTDPNSTSPLDNLTAALNEILTNQNAVASTTPAASTPPSHSPPKPPVVKPSFGHAPTATPIQGSIGTHRVHAGVDISSQQEHLLELAKLHPSKTATTNTSGKVTGNAGAPVTLGITPKTYYPNPAGTIQNGIVFLLGGGRKSTPPPPAKSASGGTVRRM